MMAASRLLPLGLFGILSYVEPVLLFGVAVLFLGETFAPQQLWTYLPIWLAVLLIGWDSARLLRKQASSWASRRGAQHPVVQLGDAAGRQPMRLQAQALLQAAGEQLDAGAEQVWMTLTSSSSSSPAARQLPARLPPPTSQTRWAAAFGRVLPGRHWGCSGGPVHPRGLLQRIARQYPAGPCRRRARRCRSRAPCRR